MPARTNDPDDARRFAERQPGDERLPEEERMMSSEPRPEERLPGEPAPGGQPGRRLPGSAGPGREGLTGDDLTPEDTHPPGAGGPGTGEWHGTEGLRPGTEDLGAGVDEGFTASHRAEWSAISEEDRMPDDGLGAPSPEHAAGREAAGSDSPGRDSWPTAAGAAAPGVPLLPREETERWERLMREAAGAFVEQPEAAVERADRAVEELAARFTEAVTRRRRTLRMSWEGTETDTEQLRLALRDYRALAGRLLHG
ncbi:hypothetical protein [Streptomyces sp. NPDC046727]|uniref:hypothetical protein n=1 Tax=Streptomyces sp. NPDC046727 TaxID=3155373 RepID=UPI0033DBDFA5